MFCTGPKEFKRIIKEFIKEFIHAYAQQSSKGDSLKLDHSKPRQLKWVSDITNKLR